MPPQGAGAWPADAVRDTVAAIARGAEYQRSVGRSLWDRFLGWVMEWIGRFVRAVAESGSARGVTIALLVLLGVLIAARVAVVLRSRGGAAPSVPSASERERSPRAEAERLAAAGRFTEAAHALLAAVLAALAARGEVRLHESKTTGDYARELARRGSPARASFAAFRRRYEAAIYGMGECTAAGFDALARDAEPVLGGPRRA